ncbi:MAG TPA: sugar ABC transporter permease [Candidatus Dormibacteraeota bacterium]|nr:sugar ABC transporter permease [Candidatus Dormibacteraeota bacterium]
MATAVTTPDLEPSPSSLGEEERSYAQRRAHILPYAVIAPSLVIIGGLLAFPLGWLAWISLQHYGLKELINHQGEWVGLENYQSILVDPLFRQVLFRTLLFTVACVALTIALSTLIAMLLTRVRRVVRIIVMSALVFVWATPVIVTVDIWQWMFDYEFGVINYLLTQLHLGNFIHHNWFDNPAQGWSVFVVVVVWGAIPFVTIVLFAALLQVPSEVIEAAQVDGAAAWQRFWYVTAPILKPVFLIVTCLSTIWDFGVFNQIYVLLNERPSSDYYTIAIYSYRESFGVTQYGLGAAIAVLMVIVLVVVTFFYVRETVRVAEIG